MTNTSTAHSQQDSKNTLHKLMAIFLFTISVVMVLNPRVRSLVRTSVLDKKYQVLSSLTFQESSMGELRVLKVKKKDLLALEIYRVDENQQITLIQQLNLPDANDGYFHVNSQATNLAAIDIDQDGKSEIIAPSFDRNLVAHLNVYKFNPQAETFYQVFSDLK